MNLRQVDTLVKRPRTAGGCRPRQIRRLPRAFVRDGPAALSTEIETPPASPLVEGVKEQVRALARSKYAGLNHQHFAELPAECEGIVLHRPSVRRILCGAGVHPRFRMLE